MTVKPNVKVERITPAGAEHYLQWNVNNRNIREQRVRALVRDIENGEWKFTGDAIKFAKDGRLLDGQHRLSAIARGNTPVETLVIRGIDDDAQIAMDTGAVRPMADTLKLMGEVNTNELGSTLRVLTIWRQGYRRGGGHMTKAQMLKTLEDEPEVRDAVRAGQRCARGTSISRTALSLCWHLFNEIDEEDTEFFFARFVDGVNLSSTSPILALRKYGADKGRVAAGNAMWAEHIPLIIKAWNAYREGRPVKVLSYKRGGAKPESFPEPI